MATVAITPADPKVGTPVLVTGNGFTPSAVVTVKVPAIGVQSEIEADAAGYFGTDDIADHAVTTVTVAVGENFEDGDTLQLGAITYRFKAAPAQAYDVDIGADANGSLDNLKKAINATGTAGTEYFAGTLLHPTVTALTRGTRTLLVYAKTGGTGGNALDSVATAAHVTVTGATLAGGSAATGVSAVILDFEEPGNFLIEATDGTNEGSATVQVWEG